MVSSVESRTRTPARRHASWGRTREPSREEYFARAFCPKDGITDILLIFPPTTVAERYGKNSVGDSGGDLPPLGISYIAAYLRSKGFGVGLLDGCALGTTFDEIVELIRRNDAKSIGLSATTFALPTTLKLATRLRTEFPDKLIILGGAHANVVPEQTLEDYDCFDIVVSGDAEDTTRILMEELRKKNWSRRALLEDVTTLNSIEGICFRNEGRVVRTAPRPVIMDLDSLPFPARDLLPVEKYVPLPNQYKRTPIAHMVVIRGCPFKCTFCDQANTKARTASPQHAVAEIRHLVETYGTREVSFWDDTMTYNKKWITDFCELLIEAKLDVIWSCYAAIRTVTPEMLALMKKAGCWNIFYGIETGNQQLMRNIDAERKNISADHIREVVRWTKEAGIEVRGSFMIALPGETPEMAEETIRFAIELEPEYAQFSITTPYPGTQLYNAIKQGKWGRLTTENFAEYQGWNVVFLPEGYANEQQVWDLERKAFRSFYFRPSFMARKVLAIRTLEDIKRYVKGFILLINGFAFGPAPDFIRRLTGRLPQESPHATGPREPGEPPRRPAIGMLPVVTDGETGHSCAH